LQLKDESVSRFHASINAEADGRLTLRDLNSTNGTYVGGTLIKRRELQEGDKVLLGKHTLVKFHHPDGHETGYTDEGYHAATRDGVTGVHNRRACLEQLEAHLSFAKRHLLPVSLILFAVDCLEGNDASSQISMDLVLAKIAKVVAAVTRVEDILGRWGKEVFVLVALDTDMIGAERLANRVLKVMTCGDGGNDIARQFTISLGIAATSAPAGCDAVKLLTRAEANLSKARSDGENAVVSSEIFE
jgi:diguanylate cyclase (GGDEF)-like protein